MVSFIVIGRNEGWKLKLCFESINKAITENKYISETIYVDSQSTDNSLDIAKQCNVNKVILLTGDCNSAIARNVGVKEAKYKNLIFLDGDMEIKSDFLPLILDKEGNLKYDFVSGNFLNYYYDKDNNFLKKDYYKKIYVSEDTKQYTTGGLFALKRKHWENVKGMKSYMKKGQDLDLGYRLANNGIPLIRKKECMANHHTIDYKDESRLWGSFKNGAYVYTRAVLYRNNLFNKYVFKRILTSDPTLLVLVACIFAALVFKSFLPFAAYLALTVLAVFYYIMKNKKKQFINLLIVQILRDFLNLFAFFTFFPQPKKNIKYELKN